MRGPAAVRERDRRRMIKKTRRHERPPSPIPGVSPRRSRWPRRDAGNGRRRTLVPTSFLDHPAPIAFAHRGGASHYPENSMRAFEHAVGLGYAYLETDAHATADGVLVAFHDKTLDRVTDRAGAIASLPAKQVAAARIAGTDPIPLLEDLLAAWPDVRFNIDVKDAPAARPLADLVRKMGVWDRICITSFSAGRLRATRKLLDRPV